jgi:DNA polymerase I
VIVVQSLEELPNFTGVARLVGDTETSGVSPYHGDRICGICIGPYDEECNYYIPIRHQPGAMDVYKNLPAENVLRWFNGLTKDSSKRWTFHNAKYDLQMMWMDGLEFNGELDDTLILSHVAYGDEWNYDLVHMTRRWIPGGFAHVEAAKLDAYLKETQKQISTDEGKTPWNYSLVPIHKICDYGCEDISAARHLSKALHAREELNYPAIPNQGHFAWGTRQLLKNEMKLIKVLAKIEYEGIKIDVQRCCELRDESNEEVESLCDKMYKMAGKSFSSSSQNQTAEAMERCGGRVMFWTKPEKHPDPKKRKGKQKRDQYTNVKADSTGRPCFNSEAILDYLKIYKKEQNQKAYDFMLLYYKAEQTRRLVATNLDAYLKGIDKNNRLHGQFHMHRTWTGRLASADPNLQNITKVKGTKEQGQIEKFTEHKDEEALNRKIRDLFIAEKNHALISIDYSSIEYRLATYFSGDQKLIGMYQKNPDVDFHQITADMLGVDRDVGKTIGFGILYGMGVNSLAMALNVSRDRAMQLRNMFFDTRPAFRNLISLIGAGVQRHGGVRNPFGRWCPVPRDLDYKGLNALVQGSAGDLMRYALVALDEAKLPIKLVSSIHDETLSESRIEMVMDNVAVIKKVMCDCPMFPTMPITCDQEIGYSWGKGLMSIGEWQNRKAA